MGASGTRTKYAYPNYFCCTVHLCMRGRMMTGHQDGKGFPHLRKTRFMGRLRALGRSTKVNRWLCLLRLGA